MLIPWQCTYHNIICVLTSVLSSYCLDTVLLYVTKPKGITRHYIYAIMYIHILSMEYTAYILYYNIIWVCLYTYTSTCVSYDRYSIQDDALQSEKVWPVMDSAPVRLRWVDTLEKNWSTSSCVWPTGRKFTFTCINYNEWFICFMIVIHNYNMDLCTSKMDNLLGPQTKWGREKACMEAISRHVHARSLNSLWL